MPFYFETLLYNDKCTKILNNSVLNTNSIKPTTVLKWISKLNCNFDIHEVFKICFKVTDDTSVQWLHFRILPVSYYLKKIKAYDCCAFCKKESETIEHVFLYIIAKIFSYYGILSVRTFLELQYCTDIRVCLNINNVMLGDLPLSKHNI